MIKAIIIRRLSAMALSLAISTVIPFLVKDKPVLKWGADHVLPVVVDAVEGKLDS